MCSWLLLLFVGAGAGMTRIIVEEHCTDMANVKEMEHLDLVFTFMIEDADYTVVMALYLARSVDLDEDATLGIDAHYGYYNINKGFYAIFNWHLLFLR